jgi:adhesin transport system outer membrane protein
MMIFSSCPRAESLDLAVFKTLASHPEIKAEINRKAAREQELIQAESAYYPRVDFQAGIGYENSKNRFTRATGETDYVDLTRKEEAFIVTYNLFDGYGPTSDIDRSSARVRAAGHYLHDLTEQTALEVARVYLSVLRNQRLVQWSEETLDVYRELFEKVKSRSLSGVGRKADIDQARGRLARAQTNLVNDVANLENAIAMYLRVTGERPGDLTLPADFASKLPETLELAVKLGLQNNPTVKAAEADVDAAKAQTDGARSDFYPKVDLVFEQSRGENLDGVDGIEKDYSLMLKMNYNLFSGGFDQAGSKRAISLHSETRERLDDVRRNTSEAIRIAWNAYQAVIMQFPYLQQHVESMTEIRSAYADQFRIGQRSLLDLLDSENELYHARRALITAEFDRLVGGYQILAEIGRFVDELEVHAASN